MKCFGTEERVTDPTKRVLPSNEKKPFLTFPGMNIKDLYVHEESPVVPTPPVVTSGPPAQARSAPPAPSLTTPSPPAPQSYAINNAHPPRPPPRDYDDAKKHTTSREERKQPSHGSESRPPREFRGESRGEGRSSGGRGRGRGRSEGHKNVNVTSSGGNPPRTIGTIGTGDFLVKAEKNVANKESGENVKSEFDFGSGLNNFNKESVLAEVASSSAVKEVAKYNKGDFFDSFSAPAPSEGRFTFSEEKKLNLDTFGISQVRTGGYRGGGRGRGRGGGRGGGAGGRGRGRGNRPPNSGSISVAAI